MNELSKTILNECREEVAKSYRYTNWIAAMENLGAVRHFQDQASELALDRQAEFFREISRSKWLLRNDGIWYNPVLQKTKTELELYNIWREGK